jgi:hypothetical protein
MRFHVITFLASCTISALYSATSYPVVDVTGGKVRGAPLEPQGAVFKGIPYARPPIAEFRWREPAQVQAWKGVRDIAEGPPCAQNPYFVHDANVTSREDCLYLNVWVPAWPNQAARKPVMVWIPGGGNFGGAWNSATPARYTSNKSVPAAEEVFRNDGVDLRIMKLVQRDVILITLNYRLGCSVSSRIQHLPENRPITPRATREFSIRLRPCSGFTITLQNSVATLGM